MSQTASAAASTSSSSCPVGKAASRQPPRLEAPRQPAALHGHRQPCSPRLRPGGTPLRPGSNPSKRQAIARFMCRGRLTHPPVSSAACRLSATPSGDGASCGQAPSNCPSASARQPLAESAVGRLHRAVSRCAYSAVPAVASALGRWLGPVADLVRGVNRRPCPLKLPRLEKSPRHQFPDVVQVVAPNRPQPRCLHGGHGDGRAGQSDKLHLVGRPTLVNVNDGAHVTRLPPKRCSGLSK